MKPPLLRRLAMRDLACHGDRISAARAIEIATDGLECSVTNDVFRAPDEQLVTMDPLPCPITIAWAENDALLPVEVYKTEVQDRLPLAAFTILAGVGHMPTVDDPELVARTILATTGASATTA